LCRSNTGPVIAEHFTGHLHGFSYYIYSDYFPDEHIGLARFFLVMVRIIVFEVVQNGNFLSGVNQPENI